MNFREGASEGALKKRCVFYWLLSFSTIDDFTFNSPKKSTVGQIA